MAAGNFTDEKKTHIETGNLKIKLFLLEKNVNFCTKKMYIIMVGMH